MRKDEILSIPVWCFHRDSRFFPNPEKFDPERFSEENKHKINPMTYMPFGLGPRNCIGKIMFLENLYIQLFTKGSIKYNIFKRDNSNLCYESILSVEIFLALNY